MMSLLQSVWSDLRFAARTMRRSPGFYTVVILTLALGIGANTALFTIVDAVLLKPLPVANPHELVQMEWDSIQHDVPLQTGYDGTETSQFSSSGHAQGTSFPYITYERLRQASDIFSDVFAFATDDRLNVIVDGQAELASAQFVTGNYYHGLGINAWRGRMLADSDDNSSAPPAAVITYRYWERRFGGDASALGKTITVNNVRFTIVGISPRDFSAAVDPGQTSDLTIPISTEPFIHPQGSSLKLPAQWWLRIMGRLQPGVTYSPAQARIDAVFQQSIVDGWKAAGSPQKSKVADPRDYPHLLIVSGARGDAFARLDYHQPLLILMAVVGMLLLIACINVANLLLARSSTRQPEFAMRISLGARRSRIVRQLLTESLLLSAAAALLGVLFAMWGKALLLNWTAWIRGAGTLEAGLDVRVLAFTIGISAATGILFGLAPASRAGATQIVNNVRTQIGGVRRGFLRKALIILQVAVSVVLLVTAGLFVRTLHNILAVDPGFNRNNLLLFRVRPEATGYTTKTSGPLYDRMIERLDAIPGVESVSLSRQPLLAFSHKVQGVYLSAGNPHNGEIVDVNIVSPSFFKTMGIPLLLGRPLLPSDTQKSSLVVVVNEAFAKAYLSGATPTGESIWLGGGGEGIGNATREPMDAPPPNPPMQIVGIVRDTKYTDLRTPTRPAVYEPYAQVPTSVANLEVRYRGDEAAVVSAVRAAMREVDPKLPIYDLRTQNEQSEQSVAEERMFANLSSGVGLLTLLLAAVGLYGIVSYSVGRRTNEIGVRMALGAQQGDVLSMVLRESLGLVIAGIAIGVPVALATAHIASDQLADLLFRVKPIDTLSLTVAVFVMISVAVFASYLPARRAARIDPMAALRSE
ncbi:MAG TPA: ABC transporter permease [Terriglobales bacterium]|nr:ABC transporter permease [Terriglobales bacterium]